MAPRGKHPWEGILLIDDSVLATADRIATEGMRIFGAADPAYARLKRGLDAWDKATMEGRADARLHDLVRSLEALMSTKSGKTRRQFVQRGQLFVNARKAPLVLGQMYDIRSAYEHGNDWRSAIGQTSETISEEAEVLATLRSLEAELIARDAYRRVLLNRRLSEGFNTLEANQNFWVNQARRSVWGPPLDVLSEIERVMSIRHKDELHRACAVDPALK
jgi:hypothetical protein